MLGSRWIQSFAAPFEGFVGVFLMLFFPYEDWAVGPGRRGAAVGCAPINGMSAL